MRLRIDKAALAHNWRALDALSGRASAGAAVKADCYGLGVGTCVPVLRDAGCNAFFVAHWSEVPAVAAHVPAQQIAVLHGVTTPQEIAYARATGAVPVINSLEQAKAWLDAGPVSGTVSGTGAPPCHLMVDTGINRLGVSPRDLSDPSIAALNIDTLMSHLANADEDNDMNGRQLAAFEAASAHVAHKTRSLANSAGIALGASYAFDLTRPGLALYGGIPRAELSGTIRQVAHIEAAIIQTRTIEAGESVGYNGAFTAPQPMRIATISMGYADGFLRSRGIGGYVEASGTQLPILGKVSMDMIVVDCGALPDIGAGDFVSVPFVLPAAAQQSDVSQYELLTTIGSRLRI